MEPTNGLVAVNPNCVQPYPSRVNVNEVPIIALRYKSRYQLSKLLNPTKILLSEEGYPRDWRGIAHLAGIPHDKGVFLDNHHEPTAKVLQIWAEKDGHSATIGELRKFLGMIDRWDVESDIMESLVEDATAYVHALHEQQVIEAERNQIQPAAINAEKDVITIDDVTRIQQGLEPQQYDAFVLFADEDIDFATELIGRMEDCGFKLCVKERDLVGGISFEHEAILRLISERCNRLIVIVSPAFLKSSANTFFVNFAQALGIEQGRRKIVPCVYEMCDLPPTLSFYFLLNYRRSGRLWNFWEKLRDSIQTTTGEQRILPKISITEVTSQNESITPFKENTPIKAPRKRRDKQKLSFADSMSSQKLNEVSLSSSPEEKRQASIMPPMPRLRDSTSMVNLTTMTNQPDTSWHKSKSDLSVNGDDNNSAQTRTAKLKWYKKILSSNSASNLLISNNPPKEKAKKRTWFRKKAVLANS